VAGLAAANPVGPVIAAMQTAITWAGKGHQVLQAGKTYPARSISALGNGAQYHFTRYNTYTASDYTPPSTDPLAAINTTYLQWVSAGGSFNTFGNSAMDATVLIGGLSLQ
jgi:hypothetical protein